MLYEILRPVAVFLFKIYFRYKVKGRENIPLKGAFILASNHLSYLDPVFLGVCIKRKLSFMAKSELFKNKFFSLLIKTLGAFPVKRNTSDFKALKEAINRIKKGEILVIFPQGTRTKDKNAPPLKGIGFLVKKTRVPVICCRIFNTDLALPSGKKIIYPVRLKAVFSKPLDFSSESDSETISFKILKKIYSLS